MGERMPRLGEVVLFRYDQRRHDRICAERGNCPAVPAIVVEVHGPSCVNLRVQPNDSGATHLETSVPLNGTQPEGAPSWEFCDAEDAPTEKPARKSKKTAA